MAEQRDQLAEARAARDASLAQTEAAADPQDGAVIDQAIATLAATGQPFSANDLRELLPEVRRPLVGARFMAASRRKDIVRIGYVPSTDPGTHAHPIALWQGRAA